jgi:hypothetical protein
MSRDPLPPLPAPFNGDFGAHLKAALNLNPAIHDGATMVGRHVASAPYELQGWSFRLFPPNAPMKALANKGSAFNSCLAMSFIPGVDQVLLWSGQQFWRFQRGVAEQLDAVAESPSR